MRDEKATTTKQFKSYLLRGIGGEWGVEEKGEWGEAISEVFVKYGVC